MIESFLTLNLGAIEILSLTVSLFLGFTKINSQNLQL